jgi:hypothetical protein
VNKYEIITNTLKILASTKGARGHAVDPYIQQMFYQMGGKSTRSIPNSSQSQSYIMTNGQSSNLSWCQAPIRGPLSDCYAAGPHHIAFVPTMQKTLLHSVPLLLHADVAVETCLL